MQKWQQQVFVKLGSNDGHLRDTFGGTTRYFRNSPFGSDNIYSRNYVQRKVDEIKK